MKPLVSSGHICSEGYSASVLRRCYPFVDVAYTGGRTGVDEMAKVVLA